MNLYLKIKVASLAAEARIIRTEEQKLLAKHRKWRAKAESRKGTEPPALFFSIQAHRKMEVRTECRAAQLAQGFIRGTAYRAMEATCHVQPNWGRVAELVKKYGGHNATPAKEALKAWRESSAGLKTYAAAAE